MQEGPLQALGQAGGFSHGIRRVVAHHSSKEKWQPAPCWGQDGPTPWRSAKPADLGIAMRRVKQ